MYELYTSLFGCSFCTLRGDLVQLHHTFDGDPAAKFDDDHFFDALVKDLVFSITDLSRVPFAQWRFSVPKSVFFWSFRMLSIFFFHPQRKRISRMPWTVKDHTQV